MIAVGETAPDFEAPTAHGEKLQLARLRGHPVILYFYPKADTPGCTVEAKGFRDEYERYRAKGVEVVGVSVDPVEDQCAFQEKYTLPFPLIADASKQVARRYGVLSDGGSARRVTFLLDASGSVVEVVDDRRAETHLERARARFLSA
ncbi:MAG: peroxiredoxin [Thermoplasmata archaeon]